MSRLALLDRWPLLGLLLAGMLASLLFRGIFDVDVFWRARLGELTLAGGFPTFEPFLYGQDTDPHVPVAWLAEVILSLCRQVGGWRLAQTIDSAAWLGGFALTAFATRRALGWEWPVALALWLAFLVAVPQASLRPQTWALLSFGIVIRLYRAPISHGWRLGLIIVTMLFWQNAHPSLMVGGLYLTVNAVGDWIRGRRCWGNLALLLICAVALFATPAGFDILSIAWHNAAMSQAMNVGEWDRWWDHQSAQYFASRDWTALIEWQLGTGRARTMAALMATSIAVVFRRSRLRAEDVIVSFVLAGLMLSTYRFVLFWSVSLIPLWARILAPTSARPDLTPLPGRRGMILVAIAGAVAIPWLTKSDWLAGYFPRDGANRLRETVVTGPVYTNHLWGGLIIDTVPAGVRVTHDGRYYRHPLSTWREYEATARGEIPLEVLLKRYPVEAFFLRPGDDDGLIRRLEADPGWVRLDRGAEYDLFIRRR